MQYVALGVAAIAVMLPLGTVLLSRVGRGVFVLELPLLLLLFGTLVFRQRSAADLVIDPLDPAAQLRVAAILLAGLIGVMALLSPGAAREPGERLVPLPLALYMAYVLIVFAGAPQSLSPTLTAYRGVELAAGLAVLLGARQSLGRDASPRIEAVLYWFTVALVASAWMGVLVFPDQAIADLGTPGVGISIQLQGAYPSMSANFVGTLGVVLAVWSPARIRRRDADRGLGKGAGYTLSAVGMVTLLAAQYRTGYVAIVAALAVFVTLKGHRLLAAALVASAIAIAASGALTVTEVQPVLLRGQTPEEAQRLSGRVEMWHHALPVWEKSPIIGRGLLTGTRLEVLEPLGRGSTSTIHSTWIEVVVGTGIAGTTLVGSAFLVAAYRALRQARSHVAIAPLVLLIVLAVRSITGSTFEIFGYLALLFLWLALSLNGGQAVRPQPANMRRMASNSSP